MAWADMANIVVLQAGEIPAAATKPSDVLAPIVADVTEGMVTDPRLGDRGACRTWLRVCTISRLRRACRHWRTVQPEVNLAWQSGLRASQRADLENTVKENADAFRTVWGPHFGH